MSSDAIKSALGAIAGLICLLLFALNWLGAFKPKPPAPPEALGRLKAFVETEGRQAPSSNNFSMPGGVGSAGSADQVQVSAISFEGSPGRIKQEINGVPAGAKLYYYGVKARRTKADGAQQLENRLFLFYQDAAGEWRFAETKRPDYESIRTEALK